MKITLIAALAVLPLAASLGAAPPVAEADDRPVMFLVQAQALADTEEAAEGLVRCGIRDRTWADFVEFRVSSRVMVLAFRLWPNAKTNDAEAGAVHASYQRAREARDVAVQRGQLVTPQWCVDTGPAKARALDEFARDTSYFIHPAATD